MPPGWNEVTFSRENCRSRAVAAGRRSPTPLPLMQANMRSLTRYASRPPIFLVATPGSLRSTASICALRGFLLSLAAMNNPNRRRCRNPRRPCDQGYPPLLHRGSTWRLEMNRFVAFLFAFLATTMALAQPASTGRQSVNGIDYYYEIHGQGEPLLLLHGGLGSIDMFA